MNFHTLTSALTTLAELDEVIRCADADPGAADGILIQTAVATQTRRVQAPRRRALILVLTEAVATNTAPVATHRVDVTTDVAGIAH